MSMRAPDHLATAERLLSRREPTSGTVRETQPPRPDDVALAQAHATVALAQAIRELVGRLPDGTTR